MSDTDSRLKITAAAADEMLKTAATENVPPVVRVVVKGGGCAGFTYELYFDAAARDTDEVFDEHGVKVIIDPVSLQYMEGTVIDYESRLLKSSGFVFKNPRSTGSCGCGNSFST